MADKKIAVEIDVNAKGASKTLGQLEADFERLNQEIKEVPLNSKKFNELQKELAQTGREVKNVELAFESLDNEQVASELGSVAGAVGDVSAAFILLGDDSETLQEVAKNIEMAMGVSMGLKGAIEGVSSARKLLNNSTVVSTIATKANAASNVIAAGAQSVYAVAVGASTGALKLFRIAMLATGIGALIAGVVLLIANFDKVTEAIKSAGRAFISLGKGVADAIALILPIEGIINGITSALEYLGIVETETEKAVRTASEKRIAQARKESKEIINQNKAKLNDIQKYTKGVIESIDWEIRKRTAAGKEVGALEAKKLLVLKDSAEQQIKLLESTILQSQKLQEGRNAILKSFDQIAAEANLEVQKKLLKDSTQNIEIHNTEVLKSASDLALAKVQAIQDEQKKVRDLEAAANEKSSALRKAKNEKDLAEQERLNAELARLELERIQAEQEALQNQLTREEEQFQLLRDLRQTDQENEIDDLMQGYESKFELANGNAELELALQDQLNKDLKALNDKYRVEEIVADEKKIELERLNNKQRVELGSEALGALSTLVSAFSTDNEQQAKKQFKVNKALNLAQATTNTALAVTGALSEVSLVPGARFAKAAIAGTIGAANIVKIASTQFGSAGGGGSTVSLGNTSNAVGGANVPAVSNTTTTLDGSTQVFVTEQDITGTQNKVQVAEDIATV